MRKDKWKDKFVELLFFNDPSKINAIKAAELKYSNFPSFLCKYMTFDEEGNSLNSLKDNKIFLLDPNNFNDPYDSVFSLKEPLYIDDRSIKEMAKRDPVGFKKANNITNKQFSKVIKSKNNHIKVLSRFIAENKFPELKKAPTQIRKKSIEIEKEFRGISADVNQFKENLLLSCFSEDHKSILMWSHYAQ